MPPEVTSALAQDAAVVETAATAPAVSPETDPFGVDESQFVSLTPEQRAALDPVLSKWKETAKSTLEKERSSFKPHLDKAKALDQLVRDPRFVKWYQDQQNATRTPDSRGARVPRSASPQMVRKHRRGARRIRRNIGHIDPRVPRTT